MVTHVHIRVLELRRSGLPVTYSPKSELWLCAGGISVPVLMVVVRVCKWEVLKAMGYLAIPCHHQYGL